MHRQQLFLDDGRESATVFANTELLLLEVQVEGWRICPQSRQVVGDTRKFLLQVNRAYTHRERIQPVVCVAQHVVVFRTRGATFPGVACRFGLDERFSAFRHGNPLFFMRRPASASAVFHTGRGRVRALPNIGPPRFDCEMGFPAAFGWQGIRIRWPHAAFRHLARPCARHRMHVGSCSEPAQREQVSVKQGASCPARTSARCWR